MVILGLVLIALGALAIVSAALHLRDRRRRSCSSSARTSARWRCSSIGVGSAVAIWWGLSLLKSASKRSWAPPQGAEAAQRALREAGRRRRPSAGWTSTRRGPGPPDPLPSSTPARRRPGAGLRGQVVVLAEPVRPGDRDLHPDVEAVDGAAVERGAVGAAPRRPPRSTDRGRAPAPRHRPAPPGRPPTGRPGGRAPWRATTPSAAPTRTSTRSRRPRTASPSRARPGPASRRRSQASSSSAATASACSRRRRAGGRTGRRGRRPGR